ncbi:MAG: putative tellurite resistance protein B-like protein [Myxococcota bacterium]|jgi:uncharacterized tellurite resistance protein B-like protein
MIFFGTRGVTYNHQSGQFHCPSCESTNYSQKRVRRFFTLYWVPLIPLDLLGEYVECDDCRSTFNSAVLEFDPSAGQAEFEAEWQRVVRRVLVNMMLADGVVEEKEIVAIQEVYAKLANGELPRDRIESEMHRARTDDTSLKDYLAEVASTLNDRGKELVVRAALMVAAADGDIAEEEMAMLVDLAKALEIPPSHFNTILHGDSEA